MLKIERYENVPSNIRKISGLLILNGEIVKDRFSSEFIHRKVDFSIGYKTLKFKNNDRISKYLKEVLTMKNVILTIIDNDFITIFITNSEIYKIRELEKDLSNPNKIQYFISDNSETPLTSIEVVATERVKGILERAKSFKEVADFMEE